MVNIYLTFEEKTKENYDSRIPSVTSDIASDSIDDIFGDGVLEKVKDLPAFINECYRILKVGSKANFHGAYYNSAKAWSSPFNIRGVSEMSLNFASKDWREQTKYSEATILANFDVAANFAIEESCVQRAEETRNFWMQRYSNIVQIVCFTLTKK